MIIDTHSHLNAKAFNGDFDGVAKRTLAAGMWMVNVGMDFETSKRAIEIAQQYSEGVFATIGLHPTDNDKEAFDEEKYKKLAQTSQKVVAVGEIGLDYYHKPKGTAKLQEFKEKQKKTFLAQLNLAESLQLPVVLHCRMAHQDMIEILKGREQKHWELRPPNPVGVAALVPAPAPVSGTSSLVVQGVVHCFTGTVEEMKEYIKLGFYIGINGIIFKLPLDEVVKSCPLESMVLETDCPYLTPPQEGKSNRNEPLFIKHTIQKVTELKGVTFDAVAQITTENAKRLFNV